MLLKVETENDQVMPNQLPSFPQNDDLNATPSLEKVKVDTHKMKNDRNPGRDGIPAEVYKYGGEQLKERLHQLIKTCWRQGTIMQGLKDVTIIPLFKNKGDYRNCGNYRGLSLLSIADKTMA